MEIHYKYIYNKVKIPNSDSSEKLIDWHILSHLNNWLKFRKLIQIDIKILGHLIEKLNMVSLLLTYQ